ncbi:hypothetical protein VMCG_06618 [Cytospora schulzeri]|uniref:Peptidase S8/S53 domain-containing protein n=1 Tax=Cytospora schulzeri TaxID=448051 RepID=A0A423W6Z3_9PEZI|nr:hypothetical protein VMCG_06618 [Valsa malicola]
MALSRLLVGLLAAAGLALAKTPRVLPGAFILEYEDEVDIDSHLSSVQHLASTRLKLDHKLFKGASIRFHDVDKAQHHAELLASTPHVKKIWPVYLYDIPEHTIHWTAEDATAMAAQDVPTARQAPPPDTFSPHVMTQVNRLRDEGIVGQGIKIAVVDSGIDYTHPALGGCFGPGCLVSSGWDFVGDAFTGQNTPVPGPDPPLDCGGHGTHVAGIIAAQEGNPYGVIGAATGVTLSAYRVFGCSGTTTDDVVIAAFNKAYEDGADIITASLGRPSGWKEEPWSVAVSRIVENGVPCTISADNSGGYGLFQSGTGGDGKRATAIASVDNIVTPQIFKTASYMVEGGLNEPFGYAPGVPNAWLNVTLPLWAVSFNTTDPSVACSPLSSQSPNLSGYVVLVRRGACDFDQKLRNLVAKGAHHVLFYNNQSTGAVNVSAPNIPGLQAVGMVTAEQGATWTALSSSQNITVALADPRMATSYVVATANNMTGGYMSTYTGWGPTYEVDLKPQFAAPGGKILSTYLTKSGNYMVMSGTSMAAPFVAAIYALLMSARGTKDPQTLESLISSTSNPVLFNDGETTYPVLAPTVQQGSGIVQAYDAAYATSLLSVSRLSFNDTDNIRPVQHFTISNNGSEPVFYTLSHAGAATAYTLPSDGSIYPAKFPAELHDDYATIEFSDEEPFILSAGQRKVISVTATPPAGLDARRLPVYSGYIAIKGSDGSGLSLPYVGVAGSLHSATILDAAQTFVARFRGPLVSISANHTFILPPPGHDNDPLYINNLTDFPRIAIGLALGSALVRIDVVPVSVPSGTHVGVSVGLRTLGDVFKTPEEYHSRGQQYGYWGGALSNGEQIPAGTYKLVIRALKIFGDRDKADDYETVETPEFSIRYMDLEPIPAGPRRRQRGWDRDHVRNH